MKKRELEIFLEKIPDFSEPKIIFEQYKTPATIAADVLFHAFSFGDIQNKVVLDLGCGTGIFSVGSVLLDAKKVIGTDIDKESISIAKKFSEEHNISVHFQVMDISKVDITADTVLMNPPFGAQKKNLHADRIFVKKAVEQASVVYSLHLEHTVPFVQKLFASLGAESTVVKSYDFKIKGRFFFHKKLVSNVKVALLRSVVSSQRLKENTI